MAAKQMLKSTTVFTRQFHSSRANNFRVAVVGAAGGIGQPLSLLLKQNPLVTELSLYDVAPVTPGVGADLSHIDTGAKVTAFTGEQMDKALANADVIVIPAGVPRKPGMTRDDLFNINAGIVAGIAKTAAKVAPNAAALIISNPVNSTVPIYAEILKKNGKFDPKKVFGVTTLDVVRANTFVSQNQGTDVSKANVPVIGGHAGTTILPILSQVQGAKFSDADRDALTHRIMFGGDEVVQAKAGGGSATLSMAFAGARFTDKVLRAFNGEKNVQDYSYVQSDVTPVPYFSTLVTLGKNGAEKIHPVPQLNDFEKKKYEEALPQLKEQIEKGVQFAANYSK